MTELQLKHLLPDPRNPNICSDEVLAKLAANIQRTNLCPPLIVRPHPSKKSRFILIDGHHRKVVLERLGWEKAPCQVWDISEHEAQLALATLNRLRGMDVPKKRAELLELLTATLPPGKLAELIPESEAQIKDLLRLMQSDFSEMEKSLKAEIEREKASLPVPYTFLIDPQHQATVDEALNQFSKSGGDRGHALVNICLKVLEKANDEPG